MKKVLKVTGIIILIVLVVVAVLATYVKLALPNVGPAPEMKIDQTAARLQRGEYLANHVMLCMDCHGTRDWSRYAGPPIPGTLGKGGDIFDKNAGFPGTFYAANITPAGLQNWTDGEIFRAITTGVRRTGKAIFPVMPYHLFGQADEEDIKSVIVYLRSLPAVENKVPESSADFPMNFILNTIPVKAQLQTKPSESDSLAYGKYMFTIGACHECHTPFKSGKFNEDMFMAGGREFNLPNGLVTSANLTPDKETGIGTWTKEIFLGRFKLFRDSAFQHQAVTEKDPQTIMPWVMYAGMSDRDLSYIYAYLRTVPAMKHSVTKFKPH